MHPRSIAVPGLLAVLLHAHAPAADPPPLDEHLEPLRPWIDKTFRGEFAGSTPEKPQVDVSRWERALNGRAIRVLHSINDGAYGGESLIFWDSDANRIAFHYFTTAGFRTTGFITVEGRKLTSHEKVSGNSGGTTEVRATIELGQDGTMTSKAELLKDGKWVPGHSIRYREDPKAEVKFR